MEERTYADAAQGYATVGKFASAQTSQPAAADLNYLRNLLETHLSRAIDIGVRARTISDTVLGVIPMAGAPSGSGNANSAPSLAELIDRLGNALSEIDIALARL